MGWLGKAIGGTIGFAFGGPLGAVAGAVFGHAFDKNSESYTSEDHRPTYVAVETAQSTFFLAAFSMLSKLTQADGQISQDEIRSIERFMDEELKLSPISRQVAINIFNAATNATSSFEDFARQFYGEFHNRPQILEYMLDILLRVSVSDGNISRLEDDMIRRAAQIFRISDAEFRSIHGRYVQGTHPAYAVLKCSESDTNETIKQQYRKLVMEYHPDKIAAKGLPEEFVQFANDKFREIQEAYEAIQKERGLH